MALKLLRNLKFAGLVGVLALALSGKAEPQQIAPENGNFIQAGARNYSSKWSYGPEVERTGFYLQAGHGISNKLTAYAEVFTEIPAIKEGLQRPGHPEETFNVSPNHFIAGMAAGGRSRVYESKDKTFSLCTEARVSRSAGFDDFANWSAKERSEVIVNGITSVDAGLWVEKRYNDFNFRGGVNLNSSFASGSILNYTINPDSTLDIAYAPFNQRNKNGIEGIFGIGYQMENGWTINTGTRFGTGASIDIGFGKKW